MLFMSMVESIRIALVKRGNLSESELARRMGVSPQNLHNKMKRDNFTETDLREIAEALGLQLDIAFVDPETKERV
jgi:transcriptional regulator with XRE-family HTH domain